MSELDDLLRARHQSLDELETSIAEKTAEEEAFVAKIGSQAVQRLMSSGFPLKNMWQFEVTGEYEYNYDRTVQLMGSGRKTGTRKMLGYICVGQGWRLENRYDEIDNHILFNESVGIDSNGAFFTFEKEASSNLATPTDAEPDDLYNIKYMKPIASIYYARSTNLLDALVHIGDTGQPRDRIY